MIYNTEQEFKDWLNSTVPQKLQMNTSEYTDKQVLAMIHKHTEDVA